ncbi:MAG: hypothetical protein A2X64_09925 [Ignavibacteria bacterium GWF2_33_9]|nr:MAG: hypothetical protein A2X64_09925 [Ignavibacteria bacterium GWF2_33_9]
MVVEFPVLCQNPEWKKVDDAEKFSEYRGFKKIICNDSMNCIVWGFSTSSTWCQFFRKTTDGGKTWNDIYIDSSYIIQNPISMHKIIPFNDFAYKGNTIIAVGDSGRLIYSNNNGFSFKEKFFSGPNSQLYKIRLFDEMYGILYQIDYNIRTSNFYETKDGGSTWEKINLPDSLSFQFDKNGKRGGIAYNDYNIIKRGLFVTYFNRVYVNPDFWELSWIYGNVDSVRTYKQDSLYLIKFVNEKEGWKYGGGTIDPNSFNLENVIYHTTNSGQTWVTQRDSLFTGFSVTGMDAFDNKFAIATTGTSYVLMTHNGGMTWVEEQVDSIPNGWYATARYPQITSYSSAYIITTSPSMIYKYTRDWSKPVDTSTVGVRYERIIENDFSVYPNPVKDKLSVSDFSEGKIEFEIYDMLGIKRIEGKVFNEIYVAFLPKGIYFLKLNNNNKVIKFVKE